MLLKILLLENVEYNWNTLEHETILRLHVKIHMEAPMIKQKKKKV